VPGVIKTIENTLRILGLLFYFFFLVGFLRGVALVELLELRLLNIKYAIQERRHEPPGQSPSLCNEHGLDLSLTSYRLSQNSLLHIRLFNLVLNFKGGGCQALGTILRLLFGPTSIIFCIQTVRFSIIHLLPICLTIILSSPH
jgi:hypothetical protein